MNTKKNKNKNRPNKPQNPNPPQKLEPETQKLEPVSEVVDSALKSEERVPEIISEVVNLPVSDIKEETGNDSPKKPKRNRGKKKKGDAEEINVVENTLETAAETNPGEVAEAVKIKADIVIKDEEDLPLTPAERKKKGKNKSNKQQTEKPKEENIPKTEKIESKAEEEKTELKEVSSEQTEIGEQEPKASKKKTKKNKKRNDSEKSDTAEDFSCTSAFQKILSQPKGDLREQLISDSKIEDVKESDSSFSEPTVHEVEISSQNMAPQKRKDDKQAIINVSDPKAIADLSDAAMVPAPSKNKKKNKKDNKLLQLTETNTEPALTVSFEKTKAESSTTPERMEKSETRNISPMKSVETNIKDVSTGTNQTSKAKIVKPVEKKGKEKPDIETQKEKPTIPEVTETEQVSEQKQIVEETRLDTTDLCSSPDCTKPSEHTKARKKKGKGNLIIAEVEIIPDLSQISVDVMPKELKELELMALTETITPQKPLNIPDIKESELIKDPGETAIEKQTETISFPDIDSRKKRKKSPKPANTSEKKDKETIEKYDNVPLNPTTEIGSQIKSTESVMVFPKDAGNVAPDESPTKSKEKKTQQETKRHESPKPLTKLEKKEVKTIKKDMATAEPLTQTTQNIVTVSILTQPETNTPKVNLDILKKSITESVKHIESIEIPEIEPRKQRKKSPKLPIKTEKSTAEEVSVKDPSISETAQELKQTMPMVSTDPDICEDVIDKSKEYPEMNIIKVPEQDTGMERKKSPLPSTKPSTAPVDESSKKFTVETSPPTPRTEDMPNLIPIGSELELPLNVETLKEATTKSLDCMKIPNQESGKKRKKSPKPSKKSDADIPIQQSVGKIAEETKEPKSISLSDILKMETKTPSTATEEKHPDLIEHPRAVSAEVRDNNNNTFIQEVIPPASKSSVPFIIPDTPFIQEPTKAPLVSPDIVSSGVRVMDIKTSAKLPKGASGKHDLKSKVMEVNQDMEDLRMSIERSLAELTALEKKDEEFEKKYAVDKLSSEDDKKEDSEQITYLQKTDKEPRKDNIETELKAKNEIQSDKPKEAAKPDESTNAPVCPARKDNKGKGKSKKKGCNQPHQLHSVSTTESTSTAPTTDSKDDSSQETKKAEKSEQQDQSKTSEQKGKQQPTSYDNETGITEIETNKEFDPIENFEDAFTSSADDVNKTFEVIAKEATDDSKNPEINITEPDEEDKTSKEKQKNENPLSQPKNLLGHPDIPVSSNRTDYKKEKNKPPNTRQAKVKIKDSVDIEKGLKHSKESQTENKKLIKNTNANETVCVTSENDEYVYKYSFRKVFLSSNCHSCKKDLRATRIPCSFCSLIFYCNQKHRDEDWPQHQGFCFAVSTIVHLKGLKHIYASAANITGQAYRLLRMQMIVSCEKVLKRKLSPCEQEMLLYPRLCGEATCREWRQGKLQDCAGCGQISFCADNPDHLPKSHARWCKSYCLYQKLVVYQLTQGRLEPSLPGRLLTTQRMSDNINRLLADMYEEKIDMSDMQYASLTQLATAPLTAAYCYQIYNDAMKTVVANGVRKTAFTIHVVGAELQFEADSLNKWEVFFLHLKPDVQELRVVLVGPELNPSKLPLDLLGKIKLCATCRLDKRRVVFSFHDRQMFHDYCASEDFLKPDIVCAFNTSINRSSMYDNQNWKPTVNAILKLKVPLVITSYTMNELQRDLSTIKNIVKEDFNTISEAKFNPFSSVRPDRNFITDDEMPLLFKNYCYAVLIGAF